MIHALFLQKSLLVFYLGKEKLSSQPSHSSRELEHGFRALCGTQLGILKHHTQQHKEQRLYALASVHLKRRFILISVKQQSSLLLTFSSSLSPVVIPQIRPRWHPKQRAEHLAVTHYGIRLQLRLSRSARWSEEWEARQTHAFGLSSAAYCMLLSCGKAQPRCCSRGKCPLLRCCRWHLPQRAAGWPELAAGLCCSPTVGWDNKSHRIPVMITVCPEVPKNMGYAEKQQHNFIITECFSSRKELF